MCSSTFENMCGLPRCMPDISVCHNTPYSGHFRGTIIVSNVLQSGYFWPSLFKDVNEYVKTSDICPRI